MKLDYGWEKSCVAGMNEMATKLLGLHWQVSFPLHLFYWQSNGNGRAKTEQSPGQHIQEKKQIYAIFRLVPAWTYSATYWELSILTKQVGSVWSAAPCPITNAKHIGLMYISSLPGDPWEGERRRKGIWPAKGVLVCGSRKSEAAQSFFTLIKWVSLKRCHQSAFDFCLPLH